MTSTVLQIDGITAGARVAPASRKEVAEALHGADERGEAVAPVGAGTQLDLGMPPARLDLVIETTRLSKVVEYEPADLTVTVEAGMRFDELQSLLGEQGQFLALDPPTAPGATLGGVIATNASGPLRFAYGTARDLVIGTRVANPDGTVTHAGGRVVKNVAGYDLNKLYIGSLGTLGIIVELSFKLAPIPPAADTLIGRFADGDAARAIINAVVQSPLAPLAIELLGPRAASAAHLPEAMLVVFRVGGYPQAVERQVRDLAALVSTHGGQRVDSADTVWDELAQMRVHAQGRDVVVKVAVPLVESTRALEILERQLSGLDPVVWAHAGNGVAYAACAAPADAQVLSAVRREVGALDANASLVLQRGPTTLKGAFDVWGDPGSGLGLMRALKAKLDPHNTLNPGRYVGGI
ncbi:MAG: FAD-binding oxidoreductase [Chloroflexi bacterium]|nr:FAD-binding oxidoreductase [Chloroflexota bacterium]